MKEANTMTKEALKLALEEAFELGKKFCEPTNSPYFHKNVNRDLARLIEKTQESLAQPEQRSVSEHLKERSSDEPVAWMLEGCGPDCGPYFEIYRNDEIGWRDKKEWTPLYTTPPQRKPLTDEQVKKAMMDAKLHYCGEADLLLARAIEAAHGIKENT